MIPESPASPAPSGPERPEWPEPLGGFDLTDHEAFARAQDGFPYEVFARLRERAPVLLHPPGGNEDGEGFWVLSRHADIAAAASDPATFSARGGGDRAGGGSHLEDLPFGMLAGVIMAMQDNPRHHLIADLLAPKVTEQVAEALEPELRATAAVLVDEALQRRSCDFATDICEPYAFLTIAVLLGIPDEHRAKVAEWAHLSTGFIERRSGRPGETSRRTFQETQDYVKELIARKRAEPAGDLASILANGTIAEHRGEDPLSEAEREQNLLLLLLTGGEQPRNTIAAGVSALARHQRQWHDLRADRSLMRTALEEMLRWAPPNPYNRRTATRDVRVGDTPIKAGDKVTLWWPSANRDENVFAGASRFDIRRASNPHMTFGHGNHYCLGNKIARMQFRILLEELLDRVSEMHPAGPVSYQPSNKHTIVLDMPVELVSAG